MILQLTLLGALSRRDLSGQITHETAFRQIKVFCARSFAMTSGGKRVPMSKPFLSKCEFGCAISMVGKLRMLLRLNSDWGAEESS